MGKEELPEKEAQESSFKSEIFSGSTVCLRAQVLEASKSIVCLSEVLGSRLLDSYSWSAHVSLHSKCVSF